MREVDTATNATRREESWHAIGAKKPKEGLTRRSFLKTGTLAVGAAAALSSIGCSSLQNNVQALEGEEILYSCVCRPNCFANCHVQVHVREGKAVKTSMAPYPNERYNRICLRGLSQVQNIYNPERLLYPLKRVGERGAGEWERISWDEATAEIAGEFSRIQNEYGKQALSFLSSSGNVGILHGVGPGLTGIMANVLHATPLTNSLDVAGWTGIWRVLGTIGTMCGEDTEFTHSKTVIVWDANITEAQMHTWHLLADAMEKGTKLVVIDPVYTILASKADLYVPIRPATNAALALSILNVLVEEDLIDKEYLVSHTVAPFVVKEDGTFLRLSDLGVTPNTVFDESKKVEVVVDPPVVWDEERASFLEADEATAPRLSGGVEFSGKTYATAFDLLLKEVEKYPPKAASKITDVPVETIIELAHLSADGPVWHYVAYGAQSYDNGVHSAHAVATICCATGNIGRPGAAVGCNWSSFAGTNRAVAAPTGPNPSPTLSTFAFREAMQTGKYKGKDYPIKGMYVYSANPVCCFVHTNEYLEAIKGLEYIVVAELFMTDTARYADLVLPVAHFFEAEDILGAGQTHYVQFNEKAVDPPGEAKSDGDVMRLLAEKMGLEQYFNKTDSEFMEEFLNSDYARSLGITLEALKKEKAMRHLPEPFIAYENNTFPTPTGRAEFYLEKPVPRMDEGRPIDVEQERLPRFFPPGEAWHENPLFEKYPLILLSERPRFRVHSTYHNNPWLRELDPEPIVKINPSDASARNIKDGEHVEVFNDRGHAVAKAVYTEAMRPGVMVYPKGWQMSQHIAGSWSELSSSSYPVVAVNQSFMDELVDVRPWVEVK